MVDIMVQALTWFGDAMVDHAETFWSLFAVDMDALLEIQPSDTWDSFPLFQILNNYLRTNGTVFTIFAMRYYASVGYGVVMCLSITRRHCLKMDKRRIMQTMPHDSPWILVF